MKKEYILTQEQKDDKRRKIEENRVKKHEQMKRKKSMENENYEVEANHQQLQLPLVQSTDSIYNMSHTVDGPTAEKVSSSLNITGQTQTLIEKLSSIFIPRYSLHLFYLQRSIVWSLLYHLRQFRICHVT